MAPECPQDNGQHFITAYRLLVSAPFYLLVSFLAVSHLIPWAVITWGVFSASGRVHSLTPGPWPVLFPFFLHPLSAYLAASHIFFLSQARGHVPWEALCRISSPSAPRPPAFHQAQTLLGQNCPFTCCLHLRGAPFPVRGLGLRAQEVLGNSCGMNE